MAPRPLAKPPVSLSVGDEVPHIFIRESHQRARKILIISGKRLLQLCARRRHPRPYNDALLSRCATEKGLGRLVLRYADATLMLARPMPRRARLRAALAGARRPDRSGRDRAP